MVVHGDDFIILSDIQALSEVERAMRDQYTIKVRAVLGAERDDAKEVRPESIRALELQWWINAMTPRKYVLNRDVRWNSNGGQRWIFKSLKLVSNH